MSLLAGGRPTAAQQRTSAGLQGPSLAVLDPSKLPSQYASQTWGSEQGLPQSRVEAVAQSASGHLWIGTQEGLARFDGVRFTPVPRGPGGLSNTDVRALAADPTGGVWVGTRRGGLAHVDRHLRVRVFGETEGLPTPAVAALAVEPGGRVWVGTRDGLCHLAPGAERFACLGLESGLPDAYVRALLWGRDGALWVGTRRGLAQVRGGAVSRLDDLGGAAAEPIGALAEDGHGGLWIGPLSGHGLGYLRGGRLHPRPEASAAQGHEIDALLVDNAGSLWVGTYGGGLLRLRGARHEAVTSVEGTDISTVLSLLQDREGSLWIGTGGSGLVRLRNAKFTPFTSREGLPSERAYSVAADPEGGVWAGTTAGLARIADGRVTQTLGAADGLLGDDISVVYVTRNGTVWAGVEGRGVCQVRGGRVAECLTPGRGTPGQYASAFFQDRSGTLWLGTDAGLSRWTGTTFAPLVGPGAPAGAVTALAEDDEGTLWIGTYGAGLLYYDGAAFRSVPATAGDNVLTIHTRQNGDVWAGTDGSGLLFLPGAGAEVGPPHRLTTSRGLPSDIVPQILEDERDRLWMTSNRGVFMAPASAFEAAALGESAVEVTLYTQADGLPRTEANGGSQPAGARAADGTLYVPTAGGVASIDPDRIPTNRRPPPVVIEGMTVDGRPLPFGDGRVIVPPGRHEFAFAYAGLSFFNPDRVRHRFRLEGRDKRWTEAGDRRVAYYTDLAPGDYTFRVQALNGDGVWSETDATLAFTLEPHVWQTGWFAALCGLLSVGVALGAYKARTAQLRERQRQLEATVAARTAELAEEKAETERLNAQLHDFNETLQERVREQLEQIVRGSRLQKYFPKKVVDRILNQEGDVAVAAERRRVTVVFSDLAGFTRLSESTPPDRLTGLLNEYLNEMVALIDRHGGTLDKIMGDGIMVLFGAADEMPPKRQAALALSMAVAMQQAMGRLSQKWQSEGIAEPVALRLGVHQADVTVGNFGSDELVEFTAIGRGVNLAARLEAAAPVGGVLVSAEVHDLAPRHVPFEAPRELVLKGIDGPVLAYPLALTASTEHPNAEPVSPLIPSGQQKSTTGRA